MSGLRVIHYVNQFFGGIGAEEHAYAPLEVRDGPVGPGRALQQTLDGEASVVATIVAGDNYFVEEKVVVATQAPGEARPSGTLVRSPRPDRGSQLRSSAEGLPPGPQQLELRYL